MWYLIQRRGIKPREEWTVNLDQHLVWMKKQHEAGRILFSGPTPDRKLLPVIRTPRQVFAPSTFSSGMCTRSWERGPLPRLDCTGAAEERRRYSSPDKGFPRHVFPPGGYRR
jgi:hypothetical protein